MAIETILLAVGEKDEPRAERLANAVIDVAGPTGASVVLAHVFTDEEYSSVLDQLDFGPSSEATPDQVANRHATIRTIGDRLSDADVQFETRGAVGDHGETIVSLAKDVGADRVVVGGRRRSPTGKAVFGSVAQKVMLSSPCPVTFVRDE
jgi:nucleotide-binding universal stress UspA family protein